MENSITWLRTMKTLLRVARERGIGHRQSLFIVGVMSYSIMFTIQGNLCGKMNVFGDGYQSLPCPLKAASCCTV